MNRLTARTAAALLLAASPDVLAGAFIFADVNNLDRVAHPQNYSGTGGDRPDLTICIDTSVNGGVAALAEGSVIKAVATFNRLRSIPNNTLAFNANTDIPSGQVDFESTLLHEMGHCQGLAHPNHASESALPTPQINGTKSTVGPNAIFDQGAGADTRHGSSDDVRGDDLNLHWYIRNQNNPGLLPAVADTTTLIRALTALPGGHTFAANADRDVMAALGFPNTEASMQQGAFSNEAQRHLQHDDVTTLRLARAGIDRNAGNADDYRYQLRYVGQLNNPSNADCNLRVRLDTTSFAVCAVSGSTLSGANIRIASANLGFSASTNWYFSPSANTLTTITADTPDPSTVGQAYTVSVTVREAAGISISGEPRGTVEVSDGVAAPNTATCTITLAGTVNETGSCQLTTTVAGMHTLRAQFLGFAGWDASAGSAAHATNAVGAATTTTSITADTPDPSVVGQAYSVAVLVSSGGGTPTGTATISDGSVQCTTGTLAAGVGSCNLTSTSAGAKTLTATYAGNASFQASMGTAAHQVNAASTTTVINSDLPDASLPGQLVTVAYAVTTSAPGSGTPVGNVTVTASGGAETCTATVAAGSCQLALTGLGTRTLTASYVGNGNFAASSGTASHQVNPHPTTTTITGDTPDPTVVGQSYSVSVQVSSAGGTPAGTVGVSEGSAQCNVTLSNGSGSCNLASSVVGTRTLTASYAAQGSFAASQGSGNHGVLKADSVSAIIDLDPSPSTVGQVVSVDFAVAALPPGAGTPGGTVTVNASGGAETCSASVAVGTCALTLLSAGSRTLTASYPGDVRFNASSDSQSHTVMLSQASIFQDGFE
ncbi:MAG: Ig-like domain repeat protein [Pseudomarimonas sp.]